MSRAGKGFVPRADRIEINREFASVEAFINEYVSNISRSGVFIKSKDPLPVGTRVNLKFTVLMAEIETVEGVGEVVRVSERPRGMGVVFIHLTEHSQGLLGKLLTRREAPKPSAGAVLGDRPMPRSARSPARAPGHDTLEDEPVLSPAAKVTTPMRAVRREPPASRPPATPPRAVPPPPPPPRRGR